MKKNSHPKKIYVELTTRCNLHCKMCVKNMDGSCIPEEDMPLAVFDHLLPALTYADNLILNGIGEPLLYPNLLKIIRSTRLRLPAAASIGFQSNGVLLNKEFSQELISRLVSTLYAFQWMICEVPHRKISIATGNTPSVQFKKRFSVSHGHE